MEQDDANEWCGAWYGTLLYVSLVFLLFVLCFVWFVLPPERICVRLST